MHQDRSDRIRLLVGLEVEQIVRDDPPHAHGLVGFAGVSCDNVLEDRLDGLVNLVFTPGTLQQCTHPFSVTFIRGVLDKSRHFTLVIK